MRFSPKYYVAQVALSLFLTVSSVQAFSTQKRATTCNGSPDLCLRSYGNVSFVGAHNSYAVGTNNVAVNQDYDVTQQLNDGIRLLQMQAHNSSGVIQLCHTNCFLYNGGTLETYLGKVKTWMNANPNDVVTLLIVNSDNFLPPAYDTVFKAAGLDTLSYTPPTAIVPSLSWPTLGAMIDAGTRLVTFLDANADFTSVPYLIDEFTNIWETSFDVTDTTFDCNVNRTKGDTSTQMYLINHFLDKLVLGQPAPDPSNANTTNSASGVGSLGLQVQQCAATNGKNPSFFLVDFYEFGGGSVFEVAATANGVTYAPTSPIATPISQSSGASSSSGTANAAPGSIMVYRRDHLLASLAVVAGVILGACSLV